MQNSIKSKAIKRYRKDFIKQIKLENNTRLLQGAVVFFIIEILMYFTGKVIDFPRTPVLIFDIWCIFIIPIIYYVNSKK